MNSNGTRQIQIARKTCQIKIQNQNIATLFGSAKPIVHKEEIIESLIQVMKTIHQLKSKRIRKNGNKHLQKNNMSEKKTTAHRRKRRKIVFVLIGIDESKRKKNVHALESRHTVSKLSWRERFARRVAMGCDQVQWSWTRIDFFTNWVWRFRQTKSTRSRRLADWKNNYWWT